MGRDQSVRLEIDCLTLQLIGRARQCLRAQERPVVPDQLPSPHSMDGQEFRWKGTSLSPTPPSDIAKSMGYS